MVHYTVPEGCYFMLGDNRNNSKDSRMWDNPYVKKEKILGKAVLRYFPGIEVLKSKGGSCNMEFQRASRFYPGGAD